MYAYPEEKEGVEKAKGKIATKIVIGVDNEWNVRQ